MAGTGGPDCQWFCSGRRIPTVLPDLYLAQIRTIRTVGPLCLPSTALRLDNFGLIVLIVLILPSFKFSKISNYSNYSKLFPLVRMVCSHGGDKADCAHCTQFTGACDVQIFNIFFAAVPKRRRLDSTRLTQGPTLCRGEVGKCDTLFDLRPRIRLGPV